MTKAAELRELRLDELRGRRSTTWHDQLFRLRIQKSMGQLEAPGQAAVHVRRDLARVKTRASGRRRSRRMGCRKSEKTGHRRQRQDAEEHRRRGGAAGAARAVRQDAAADVDSSWCTTRTARRRSATTVAIVETRPLSRRKRWALDARRAEGAAGLGGGNDHDSDAIDPRRRRQLRRAEDRDHQPDRRVDRPLRAARRHRDGVGEGSDPRVEREEGAGREGRDRADREGAAPARRQLHPVRPERGRAGQRSRASRSARACSGRWPASCASAGS